MLSIWISAAVFISVIVCPPTLQFVTISFSDWNKPLLLRTLANEDLRSYVTVNPRRKAYDQGFNKEIRYCYFIPIPIQLLVHRGRGNAIMKWLCKLANNLSHLFQAFDLKRHPLGRLVNRLVDVFRASYVGMGTHRRLLPHAVAETKSFVIRVYSIVRYDLPWENSRKFATPPLVSLRNDV